MRSQIRGLDQASTNAADGISMISTAREGALSETTSILQRMRELAVQSANGTNTTSDREEMQAELEELTAEVTRIANTTEFNTMDLLDGSFTGAGTASVQETATLDLGAELTPVRHTLTWFSQSVTKITRSALTSLSRRNMPIITK